MAVNEPGMDPAFNPSLQARLFPGVTIPPAVEVAVVAGLTGAGESFR